MASAEQSGERQRDFSSPATWGDVEQVRLSLGAQIDTQIAGVRTQMAQLDTRMEARLAGMETRLQTRLAGMDTRLETQMAAMNIERAGMETRLTRLFLGAVAGAVTVIGVLVGVVQAVD